MTDLLSLAPNPVAPNPVAPSPLYIFNTSKFDSTKAIECNVSNLNRNMTVILSENYNSLQFLYDSNPFHQTALSYYSLLPLHDTNVEVLITIITMQKLANLYLFVKQLNAEGF